MNHDATHCYNYGPECPKSCYRAELTEDLKKSGYKFPVSWSCFKHTSYCPRWSNKKEETSSNAR